jgi:hypothetical protein
MYGSLVYHDLSADAEGVREAELPTSVERTSDHDVGLDCQHRHRQQRLKTCTFLPAKGGETSMPRYYFHLYQGSQLIAQDESGYECPNDEEARQFARLSKGLVALDPFLSGWPEYRFEVVNEAGRSVFRLPVSKQRSSTRKLGTAEDATIALRREGRGSSEANLPMMYGLSVGR